MAEKKKKKTDIPAEEISAPKHYSFQDELYNDIMSGTDDREIQLAPTLTNKKKRKTETKKLKPRDIILIVASVVLIISVVLAIVLPDAFDQQVTNYAQATVMKGSLSLNINATGTLTFYNSTVVKANVTDKLNGKAKLDPDIEVRYYVKECNIVNNMRIIDLDSDFVLMEVEEVGTGNDFWNIGVEGQGFKITVQDIIGAGVTLDDPMMQYALKNAYVSAVNVKEGAIIKEDTNLFTATDYTKALVACMLSQYEVNNIRLAQAGSDEDLTAKVTFTSPNGSLNGTLQAISRTPSTGTYFTAYVDLTIPTPERNSSINASNVIAGNVSVSIQTGSKSGLIIPVEAIFNDGASDYVLVKRSASSNMVTRVDVSVVLSNGKRSIIESEDERLFEGAFVYIEKEDSLLSSLGI